MISSRLVWYLERNRLISAILFFLILYFCVCAFMLLCSILCFIGNIVIIISYHGWPARWVILSGFTFVYTCVFFSWQINSAAALLLLLNGRKSAFFAVF